jgi:hypothetical protein
VTTSSERILVIATIIERYVAEHPQAADTPKGICKWWVAPQGHDASIPDVRRALDYLVERHRLSRIVLADGTTIYAREALQTQGNNPRVSNSQGRHRPKER